MHMRTKASEIDPFPGMTILGYFTRPESQGEIRIQSRRSGRETLYQCQSFFRRNRPHPRGVAVPLAARAGQPGADETAGSSKRPIPARKSRRDDEILQNAIIARRHLLPYLRHLPHGRRMTPRCWIPALRVRGVAGPAGLRYLDHADHGFGQHQRAGHGGRLARRGIYPTSKES